MDPEKGSGREKRAEKRCIGYRGGYFLSITEEEQCEKREAMNLARLLIPAENDVENRRTRPAGDFIREFEREKQISG